MNYILDTSVLVGYLRNVEKWIELLLSFKPDELEISIITYAELLYGVARAINPQKEEEKLKALISGLDIEITTITEDISRIYAQARVFLEKRGERLDNFDLLIGATAVVGSSVLVTDNIAHFKRFPGIRLYK